MESNQMFNSKYYHTLDTLTKVAVINILWFITSLVGIGVFTFMPATVAVFVLMKEMVDKNDTPVFKPFYRIFGKEYLKSQGVFLVLLLIALILANNFITYYNQALEAQRMIFSIAFYATSFLILLYIMTLLHVFLIYIYFPHYKVFRILKFAFIVSFLFPFRTILLILFNMGFLLIFVFIPQTSILFPLVFIGLSAYISLRVLGPKYDLIAKNSNPLRVDHYRKRDE